jgi:hypothetical protein
MFLRKRKTFSSTISGDVTDGGQRFEVSEIRGPRPNPEQLCMMYQADQRGKTGHPQAPASPQQNGRPVLRVRVPPKRDRKSSRNE